VCVCECVSVLEEIREESRGEKSIRLSGVCVCVGVRGRECVYECVREVKRRE
jgi:hypothetical protein